MAQPKAEAILSIEESLSIPLKGKAVKAVKTLTTTTVKLVEKGDLDKAELLVSKFRLSKVLEGESKLIKLVGMSAILFGASRYSDVNDTSIAKSKKPPKLLSSGVKQFKATVGVMDDTFRARLLGLLRATYELFRKQEELKKADPDVARYLGVDIDLGTISRSGLTTTLTNTLHTGAGNASGSLIDIAASLYSSRMASYGFLVESKFKKATAYKVNEQNDNRRCPVCARMDGKTFHVSLAYDRLISQLQITDPAEIKSQAPWPKQDKESLKQLGNMTREELVAHGYDSPPYHPLCRGLLDITDEILPALEGAPISIDAPRRVTVENMMDSDFEFSIDPSRTDAMEDLWENLFGTDVTPNRLADAWRVLGEDSNGSVVGLGDVGLDVRFTGQYGHINRTFFRDGAGDLVVIHAFFEVKEEFQARGIGRDLFRNSLDLYEDMGVARIDLDANINVGGYAWARYGALPTADDWVSLSGSIRHKLMGVINSDKYNFETRKALIELYDLLEDSTDPKDVWLVADSIVGKDMLLGTEWHGAFELTDPDVMKRLNTYLGRD